MTPHYYRRSAIHTVLLFLISLIIATVIFSSCSPKSGCYATKGMRGYGWIKCRETKKVLILDKDGAIVCTYIDNN
jgi:hypothetical protein